MTINKPRIRRNQGRIELLANRAVVDDLLAQGFDKIRIFERLQEDGAISMSYSTFCRVFAKTVTKPAPVVAPKPASGPGPKVLKSAVFNSFPNPTELDPNEAI